VDVKLLWVSVKGAQARTKDLIEIAGVQCITLLEMQECNKYLYVLIRPVDSNAIVRSLSSMIGPQECVGNQENTNVPHDGCAIVAGENATMAVASAILLILSRPTDLSLSLCEIEIAYRRLITA